MGMCAECVESIALFHCVQCADLYCRDCYQARSRIASSQKCMYRPKLSISSLDHGFRETFKNICQEWHVRGGRRNHIPIILRSFNSQTHQLPEATPAMGTGAAQILAKARWFVAALSGLVKPETRRAFFAGFLKFFVTGSKSMGRIHRREQCSALSQSARSTTDLKTGMPCYSRHLLYCEKHWDCSMVRLVAGHDSA